MANGTPGDVPATAGFWGDVTPWCLSPPAVIILVTGAVRRLCIYEIKGVWAAMLMANDVTVPEPGEVTTIYARMAREDETWEEKPLRKAFRNSQPFVPAYRYLRVSRAGNSHHFRSSVASSVPMGVNGSGGQTAT